jgi:bacterioferritin-associated ferredoxin
VEREDPSTRAAVDGKLCKREITHFCLEVTDISMPQLREPGTLQDISVQKHVKFYCGACKRWISQLVAAARSRRSAYSKTSRSVEAECQEIKRSLSELSCSLLEMISPQLTRKFTSTIVDYNYKIRFLKSRSWIKRKWTQEFVHCNVSICADTLPL